MSKSRWRLNHLVIRSLYSTPISGQHHPNQPTEPSPESRFMAAKKSQFSAFRIFFWQLFSGRSDAAGAFKFAARRLVGNLPIRLHLARLGCHTPRINSCSRVILMNGAGPRWEATMFG